MPKPKRKTKSSRYKRRAHALAGGKARQRSGGDDANRWLTPLPIVMAIHEAFNGGIDLDPASESWNPTGADEFYTQAEDGLADPWPPVRIYVNPPYSRVGPWIDHAIEAEVAGARVYMLLPVRTDAAYHQRLMRAATDVIFLEGRIQFDRPDGRPPGNAAFCSMIVGLGISVRRLGLAGTIYVPTHLSEVA